MFCRSEISNKNKKCFSPIVTRLTLWRLCVPQLTQASFLQKDQKLQNVFLMYVMLRWHTVIKNHEIWTFKINLYVKKRPNLSKKNFLIEYIHLDFRTTFFVKYIL
jgi:hypothetical protein